MTKPADIASWVQRLGWGRGIETLQVRLSSPIGSRFLKTLGLLAAALVSIEICSQASVPEGSGNFSSDEDLAHAEMLLAPTAAMTVSIVPSPAAPKAVPSDSDNAMIKAYPEPLLFSGETVSSKMLMTSFSSAPTAAAAAAPVSPVTPSVAKPKPKPRPQAQKPKAVQNPQPKLSWWRRLPWLSLP
jgi:hypothetical protein